jgi:hypothetical protein
MNADIQDFILSLKPCSNLLCPFVKFCGCILICAISENLRPL